MCLHSVLRQTSDQTSAQNAGDRLLAAVQRHRDGNRTSDDPEADFKNSFYSERETNVRVPVFRLRRAVQVSMVQTAVPVPADTRVRAPDTVRYIERTSC